MIRPLADDAEALMVWLRWSIAQHGGTGRRVGRAVMELGWTRGRMRTAVEHAAGSGWLEVDRDTGWTFLVPVECTPERAG